LKLIIGVLLLVLVLTGCSVSEQGTVKAQQPIASEQSTNVTQGIKAKTRDSSDVVVWHENLYGVSTETVTSDEIGDAIGEVRRNTNQLEKNGDSSSITVGSKLYKIKNTNEFEVLAVKINDEYYKAYKDRELPTKEIPDPVDFPTALRTKPVLVTKAGIYETITPLFEMEKQFTSLGIGGKLSDNHEIGNIRHELIKEGELYRLKLVFEVLEINQAEEIVFTIN
jgi:hypothetical protein